MGNVAKEETGGSVIHKDEVSMLAREMAATYAGMVCALHNSRFAMNARPE